MRSDRLTLIGTDRYRLAVRELAWSPAGPDVRAAFVVPARTLDHTARSLTSGTEVSIALTVPDDELLVRNGEGMIGFAGAGVGKSVESNRQIARDDDVGGAEQRKLFANEREPLIDCGARLLFVVGAFLVGRLDIDATVEKRAGAFGCGCARTADGPLNRIVAVG